MAYELVIRDAGGNWTNDGCGEAATSDSMAEIAEAANQLLELAEFAEAEFAVRVIETRQIIHFD